MRKNLLAWFFIFSVICYSGGTAEFNISVPEFIPYNADFDISLITSNIEENSDSLVILFHSFGRIDLIAASMKASGGTYHFIINQAAVPQFTINLKELNVFPGSFFQLIMRLNSENTMQARISLEGIFYKDGKESGRIENRGEAPSAELNFYKPNKSAGSCLELKPEEKFDITSVRDLQNLLTEFWIKFSSPSSFLEIHNATGEILELKLDENQVLQFDAGKTDNESYPVFISYGVWNHFAIQTSNNGRMKIYCNDILTGSVTTGSIQSGSLRYEFVNTSPAPIYIDLFRFIAINGDEITDFRERNYLSYNSVNSTLLQQITFDEQSALIDGNPAKSYELVKSDAPIFPRSPELNVNVTGRTMLLEWSGGDYKQADKYVIEKSTGGTYRQLGSITTDNSSDKEYNFIDPKDDQDDVVYYRVKQINKDASVVYSPEVKIGQGFIEPFTIEQNFPNPFNPKTSIEFELLIDSEVDIVIYNLDGSEISRLYKGFLNKGVHKFSFNGEGFPSGIYLYKISTPEYSQTRKMILAK